MGIGEEIEGFVEEGFVEEDWRSRNGKGEFERHDRMREEPEV